MGQWSREELDDAFRHLLAVTDRSFASGFRDLSEWFTCYTDDVVWNDLGFGFDNGWTDEICGLDSVRKCMGGPRRCVSQQRDGLLPRALVHPRRGARLGILRMAQSHARPRHR
jgi:hypothetical protein